ncbi:hypothetical protein BT96DRAFT_971236 [Gymnopus androsaceus JB14]|uniref:F-box domain-containing protein n=1 Tax=Gymnopus androsaceus JB14 TaxID=1447944 RepID=A0A6A4ICN4_9AGAR|nr:hypothetical protein BT96DRAFT_971236 [Gymnopus androsaceus JB14]
MAVYVQLQFTLLNAKHFRRQCRVHITRFTAFLARGVPEPNKHRLTSLYVFAPLTTMNFPSNAVFDTPELLDRILSQLDMRTLLTAAQLVSHYWHDIITQSPSIQQALCFQPKQNTANEQMQNPLLAELFEPWFDGNGAHDRRKFMKMPLASTRDVFLREDATWRQMLVAQPPLLQLGIWTQMHGMRGDSHQFEILEFPNGLRMGEFYDIGQKWLANNVSGFRVFWDSTSNTDQLEKHQFGRGIAMPQKQEMLCLAGKIYGPLYEYNKLYMKFSTALGISHMVWKYLLAMGTYYMGLVFDFC